MASQIIRASSVLVGSSKVGTCVSGSFDMDNSAEQRVTDGGVAFSVGRTLSNVKISCINVLSAAAAKKLRAALIGGKPIKLTVSEVDGDYGTIEGVVKSRSQKWDIKGGTNDVDYEIIGGEPKLA